MAPAAGVKAALLACVASLALGCSAAPSADAGDRWVPKPGDTWQWQLSGPIDTGVDADVFDVDGVEIKCRLDFGAKAIDWRGLYKNPGA